MPVYTWLVSTTEGSTVGLLLTAGLLMLGGLRLVRWQTKQPYRIFEFGNCHVEPPD